MTKLEKIIADLDALIDYWVADDGVHDDIFNGVSMLKTLDEARDALELLKEQEPRVLTLEEVLKANPVWFETHGLLLPAIIDHEESKAGDCVIVFGEFDGSYYPINRYNKKWRCWTARPTDEQREGIPRPPYLQYESADGL